MARDRGAALIAHYVCVRVMKNYPVRLRSLRTEYGRRVFLVTYPDASIAPSVALAAGFTDTGRLQNSQVQNTYYAAAHSHYMRVAGSLFALFADFYYWTQKDWSGPYRARRLSIPSKCRLS